MLLLFFGLARFVCMISTRASYDLNSNREKRKHTHTHTHTLQNKISSVIVAMYNKISSRSSVQFHLVERKVWHDPATERVIRCERQNINTSHETSNRINSSSYARFSGK